LSPYLVDPVDPLDQFATARSAERSTPAAEVLPYVRWIGDHHAGLDAWRASGVDTAFLDPLVPSY